MTAKYIIGTELSQIHIFPLAMNHCDVMPIDKIKSAGFIDFFVKDGNVDFKCYGESDSTGKKSNSGDYHVIKIFFKKRGN
jgi:hypothetical protein